MKDRDTHLWTLRNERGYILECVVRFAPNGVEVEISSDGAALISRVFPTGTEAIKWAEEEREAWTPP